MELSRRTRRGSIIVAVCLIAAGLCLGAVGLRAFGENSPNDSDTEVDDAPLTDQTPREQPPPPLADIQASRSQGCPAILDSNTEPVSDETVKADLSYLTKTVYRVQFPDGPVHGIGESSCVHPSWLRCRGSSWLSEPASTAGVSPPRSRGRRPTCRPCRRLPHRERVSPGTSRPRQHRGRRARARRRCRRPVVPSAR